MLPASKRSAPEGEEQPAQISHGSSQHQADTKRQKQEDEGVAGSRAGTAAATGSGLLSSGMGVKIVMEVCVHSHVMSYWYGIDKHCGKTILQDNFFRIWCCCLCCETPMGMVSPR